jgi:hypothetical protein
MANGSPKPIIELGAVENHLFKMDRFHGIEWDYEVAGVLDVDYKLGPAVRSNYSYGTEFFAVI